MVISVENWRHHEGEWEVSSDLQMVSHEVGKEGLGPYGYPFIAGEAEAVVLLVIFLHWCTDMNEVILMGGPPPRPLR